MVHIMGKMLKYTLISLLWAFPCVLCWGAESASADTVATKPSDKIFKGFFLDIDMVEPVNSVINDDHQGFNASLAFDFKHVFLPVVEVGYAKYDASDDYSSYISQPSSYVYKVDGPYFKIGVDFNIVSSSDVTKKYKPVGYLGARYAFSSFDYTITDNVATTGIWGTGDKYSASGSAFAQWGEFVGGIRVPVWHRLYLGMEGNYKFSFSCDTDHKEAQDGQNAKTIHQTYAPGYGDSNNPGWGFRYLLSFYF